MSRETPRWRRWLASMLLLGAASAPGEAAASPGAEDWLSCRRQILAAPQPRRYTCLYQLGKEHGDWPRARRELVALPHGPDEPSWVANLAGIENELNGCARSEDLFRRAAELYAAAGSPAGEFYGRTNILRCLEMRDPQAARAAGRELAALAERSGDPLLIAGAAIRRAQVAVTAAALEEAEALLSAYTLEGLDELGHELGRDWLIQQGRLAYALGRNEGALRAATLRSERAEHGERPDLAQVARATIDMAAVLTSFPPSAENRQRVGESARKALAAAEKSGERQPLLAALLLLGRLENDAGLLRRCGDLAGPGEVAVFTACRFAEAATIAADHPERAERLLAEAVAAGRRGGAPFALLQPWSDRLRAVFALRPRAEALAAAGELLAQIERLRDAESSSERSAELFGVWRELHEWLAGRLLESGDETDLELAFLLLENARARELRDSLGRAAPVRELREVEAGLAENEALLSFLLDHETDICGHPDGGAAVFVSTRAGTRVLPLPGRERIDPAVSLLLGEIAGRRESPELAQRLGELLFGPVEAVLPAKVTRLIVVPDGGLFGLPWALLRDRRGELLARRFELVIAPAASLLPRGGGGARPAAALVFADPAFGQPGAGQPGPGPAPAAPEKGRRGIGGAPPRLKGLPRLPLARREGQEVHRLLGGDLVGDRDASEAALRGARLSRYGVIHFAAHAVIDDELPERSALLLAPDGGGDGRLEPREIAALPLAGQLITLAGCRSALGRIVPGEGPMGLGRAFLAAGAPAVIGSLWELRDDEAADFFGRFYRRLARGERAAAALGATQSEMAAAGASTAAWAGVVLLGDGDFRLEPPSALGRGLRSLGPAELLATAAALLALAFLSARRRAGSLTE